MAGWIKRPRAQSRNPDARREAVQSDPLDALGRTLAEFAREDEDAGVRKAAIQRAADVALAQGRMHDDDDAGVREAAAKLYRQLLSGEHPDAPPIEHRMRLLQAVDERTLLEHLACHGAETALREAALKRVDRPEFTLQRLLQDPDRDLRLRLLEAIEAPDVLGRIADKTRRRDKQLHKLASARLRQLRVGAGDTEAIRAEAEDLCRELEQLPGDRDREAAMAAIERRWQMIHAKVDPVLATRHDNARRQCLAAAHAKSEGAKPAPAHATWVASKLPRMDEPEQRSKRVQPLKADVQQLEAKARFEASVAATGPVPAKPIKNKDKPPPPLPPMLEALDAALDAGHLGDADKQVRKIRPRQRDMPRKLEGQWQRAQHRYEELKRWQQWSTRRQRRQLCVDARAMRAATLHPEAIANRIRDLRQAWSRLDELEPAEARKQAANAALNRRFHGLCQRALEPAKPWFEARDQVRSKHTNTIEALLALPLPDTEDVKAMGKHRRDLVQAKRQLGEVTPRKRKALARKLSHVIDQIDAPLGDHNDKVARIHDRLIEKAENLMQLEPHERIATVRQLQAEWKALGPGHRKHDQKQWRVFRAAIDQVFAERDEHRKAVDEKRKQSQQQAQQLLAHIRQQGQAEHDPSRLQALLREGRQQWRALDIRDRSLEQHFDQVLRSVEQRASELAADAHRQQYRDWLAQARAGNDHKAMPAAIREAAQQGPHEPGERQATRELLVRLETLGNVESPTEDADLRMQVNLERLQSSLGEGRREGVSEQLDGMLAAWIRLGWSEQHDLTLAQRFDAAFEAALARIH